MNYYHLNTNERIVIAQLYKSGISIREIARQLDRSPSTISRELRKNIGSASSTYISPKYNPAVAQERYRQQKKKCGRKRIIGHEILQYIQDKLEAYWSPDQIYHRVTDICHVPSTSTIYRMIHRGQIKRITIRKLRRKGKYKRPAETRGRFNDGGRTIHKRPKIIYRRSELGHWEGDTVESGRYDHKRKSNYCFVTLAERKSRMYLAILVPNKKAATVTAAIISALKDFPKDLVKTITFDRGKEFAGYREIEQELHCQTYFCDPYCAWQKGTNENTNGLLREFYPKGMDLSQVNEKELQHKLTLMNNRPRKCLRYKTPNEVIKQL